MLPESNLRIPVSKFTLVQKAITTKSIYNNERLLIQFQTPVIMVI